jgi:hypothetical protein
MHEIIRQPAVAAVVWGPEPRFLLVIKILHWLPRGQQFCLYF